MLLAKSRPIVVIFIADGSHFARECLIAFTPWHLDAVSGSHPPHLLWVKGCLSEGVDTTPGLPPDSCRTCCSAKVGSLGPAADSWVSLGITPPPLPLPLR